MFAWLSDPSAWVALLTLTVLEIVLGIDNIVFISILTGRLPVDQQAKGRQAGLGLALIMRILLLLSITWVMKLTTTAFHLPFLRGEAAAISWKDLILLVGGLFLIYKSVKEIHGKLEGEDHEQSSGGKQITFASVLVQIMILDIVFSLDSVITAVGMADQVGVMIAAVVIAVGFMLVFAGKIAGFVEKHPTVKMLALAFLVLIGVNLLTEGFNQHVEKGYTYFAMAFAVGVEMLNLKMRSKRAAAQDPVHLRKNLP